MSQMETEYAVGEALFSKKEIDDRTRALAEQIARDVRGEELLVVGILSGAVFFLTDLVRCLPRELDVKIDFMSVSSYGDATTSSGTVRILKDLGSDIARRNVLVVEDIIDTGLTLSYLLKILKARRPKSLKTCVLLDKSVHRKTAVDVDYCGFNAPDAFVVGYGLDCGGRYRHLPDIHVVNL
ncbi:hypoxanthine phosphoribosyltransferase [Synergistales bacterium]|nr:hypoxanthine phosphoribosyltransferase [Synergistales bacterium]